MQLALWMGFSELVYLGLDLAHAGQKTHFFGQDFHSHEHETTEFPRMARMLEQGARTLREQGTKVLGCSRACTVAGIDHVEYDEVLAR